MTKINLSYIIHRFDFEKIFDLNWKLSGWGGQLYDMKDYFEENGIHCKIHNGPMGHILDNFITFNTPEDEILFILLVNSIKS